MASNTYQLPNPKILDPYPIESDLARDTSSPLAMLAMYRSDRNIAQQGYDSELQNQHEFAKQQLAQQLYEQQLKSFVDVAKLPGGAETIAQGGIPGLDMGAGPGALTSLVEASRQAQQAENVGKFGGGVSSLVNAGFTPGQGYVEQGIGGNVTAGEPVAIRTALIHAAASAANANKPEYTTVSSSSTPDAEGRISTLSTSKVKPGEEDRIIAQHRAVDDRSIAARRGVIPGLPAAPSSPTGKGTPTTSAAPTASVGKGPVKLDTNSPVGMEAQKAATVAHNTLKTSADPKAQAIWQDISGSMQGAAFNTHRMPDGQVVVIGKSGAPYKIGR